MENLTTRQQQVLDLIKSNMENTGYPPTRAEIAQALGFKSPNAAEDHIKALARKGAIELVAGASRGIRLPQADSSEPQGLPIVGQVAAGEPILGQENIEDYCAIPVDFFHPRADYLLRVKGMSMKDIGIRDGDLIAVHQTPTANNGDIVIARIEDDVTVKRFERKGEIVNLLPENEAFEPIVVDLREQALFLEGISVGLIRRD